ncbi:hypothetical protein AMTRI_Chr08g167070 [Amborella trichopoda]
MALSASDLSTLYTLLTNALSADQNIRMPAEVALSQCEGKPGFCSCLLEIIGSKDLASQTYTRLLATVYFKNSINRYWRHRRDSSGISNDEKVYLRRKLLEHLREENYQIAVQIAVHISKIARIDYPKEWPDLFSLLAQQLPSADTLTSHRVYMVLFRTLKELSTKRLGVDQRNFAEISSHFFGYTWNLWQGDIHTILQQFSLLIQYPVGDKSAELQDGLHLICERWLLCLKIISHMVVSGFPRDSKSMQEVQPVKEVCPALLKAIQSFLPYFSSFQESSQEFFDFTKRACSKLIKVLVSIQGTHPYSFGDRSVLAPVLDFCLNKITNPEPHILSFTVFLIQCMVLVKSILECKDYRQKLVGHVINENVITLEHARKSIVKAVEEVISSVMPAERIILLCNILIRRYFVFTASDLDEWYREPEEFHHEQDMVTWTEKLRPCAEALYITLFENYKHLLCPVVLSILQEAMNSCPAVETQITSAMLLKEAAYNSVGYVHYDLSGHLSFKDWFDGALSLELSNDHPNRRIIHRRVALILGQWVSEIKGDIRRSVYGAVVRLLQDSDLAVRLSAARSLFYLIEDANFSEQDFADFLPTCLELCFKLIEEVQEFDSKVQVLNLISIMIERLGGQIIQFANKLVGFFERVWEESSGESLLQIQVLLALRNFVVALGPQSPMCYSILFPILQRGIDINNPDELNLLEDSIVLWEATLSHAPSMVPELLKFFPHLFSIMERNFDHLQVGLNIIECYIILGGSDFLNQHASILAKLLDGIVGNVNDKGLLSTLPIIELLVQCFPRDASPLIDRVLQKLVVICLSGGEDQDPSKTAIRAHSGAILARLVVLNTSYFAHLISEASLLVMLQQGGVKVERSILLYLVDVWLDKVDNVAILQKKTYALALSILLTLREPQLLDKVDLILSLCASVIAGGTEENGKDDSSSDETNSSGFHMEGNSFMGATTKELRRRQIKCSDPIKQLSLENILRENLQACAALHGDASFNEAVGRLHPTVLAQLRQALKIG